MEFKQTTKDFLDVEFFQTLQDRFSEEFGIASVITDVTGLPITKNVNFLILMVVAKQILIKSLLFILAMRDSLILQALFCLEVL